MPGHHTQDDRIDALLAAALARPGGESPAGWLRRACGGNDRLWAAASAVLANLGPDGTPLVPIFTPDPPPAVAAAAAATAAEPVGDRPGDRVGPYTLVREVGRGGHGVVFEATQPVPARTVAVKVLLPGVDTAEVLRRFARERQLLADLDHPHVARVFGGGATADRRPYFAMEFVRDARPITAHCDAERLGVRGRVALLAQVCRAIDHARGRHVIHRDLKPSNLLVTRADDGTPHPKVIDFGIAKAVGPAAAGDGPPPTPLTPPERPTLGTWEYMSPEQADPAGPPVDTRADVYGLGAVLYELLAGTPPLDPAELRSGSDADRRRMIRDVVPPRPSRRVARAADPAAVAAARGTDPAHLAPQLAPELDWVALRALEKEPARRYATPGELADDLDRYLAGEAVRAVPPSRSYRLRKWAGRNRPAVAVMATLAVAMTVTTTAAVVAVRQRHRADAARAVAVTERDEADRQRREAVRKDQAATLLANFFLRDVLAGFAPARLPDRTLRQAVVTAVLEPSLSVIDARFAGQPRARAAVQHGMAVVLLGLDRPDLALPLARHAADARGAEYGPTDIDTLRSAAVVVDALHALDRDGEAEPRCRELIALVDRPEQAELRQDGDPLLLKAYGILAEVLMKRGRYAEATSAAWAAWDRQRRATGDDSLGTLDAQSVYAQALLDAGRAADAEPVVRALVGREDAARGADHPLTAEAVVQLGNVLYTLGRDAEADRYVRPARDRLRQVFGDANPAVLGATSLLADITSGEGRPADAGRLAGDALAAARHAWGDDHHLTLGLQVQLAGIEHDLGRDAEAERLARDAHDRAAQAWGPDDPLAIEADVVRAAALAALGRRADAASVARDAHARAARTLGDAHPLTVAALHADADPVRQVRRPDPASTSATTRPAG